jgi:hypothetical protein
MPEPTSAIVVNSYVAQYANPIEFAAGEWIEVEREDPEYPGWWWCRASSGKEGWVHCSFLGRSGKSAKGLSAYSARELSVVGGERGRIVHWLAGWVCLRLESGLQGWLPETHVRREDE